MMAGVRASAVFLLFISDGVMERPWVQKELAEAFRHQKPILLVVETDSRFGKPSLDVERLAKIQVDAAGQPLLLPQQIDWLFAEVQAIPMRRQKFEREAMLGELEINGRKASAGVSCQAKRPPIHLTNPPRPSAAEWVATKDLRHAARVQLPSPVTTTSVVAPSSTLATPDRTTQLTLELLRAHEQQTTEGMAAMLVAQEQLVKQVLQLGEELRAVAAVGVPVPPPNSNSLRGLDSSSHGDENVEGSEEETLLIAEDSTLGDDHQSLSHVVGFRSPKGNHGAA